MSFYSVPARSDSSPRPRGEETRAHILAAAETLFAARGYVSVTTWVDYVWERPSTAQLLLRESGRQGQGSDALTRLARPFLEVTRRLLGLHGPRPVRT